MKNQSTLNSPDKCTDKSTLRNISFANVRSKNKLTRELLNNRLIARTELFNHKFIKSKVDSDKLMIVLHGKGDSIKPFQNFDEELEIKNLNFLLLNAPKKYLDGYSWYGDPPYQVKGVKKIRARMMLLLEELKKQGWKSKNIFLFGFSQGCLISADTVLNYPEKLGGFVGVSGYFQFYPKWKTKLLQNSKTIQTPWLLTHGTKDDVLEIETTRKDALKIKAQGIDVKWVEFEKDHSFHDTDYRVIKNWVKDKLRSLGSN